MPVATHVGVLNIPQSLERSTQSGSDRDYVFYMQLSYVCFNSYPSTAMVRPTERVTANAQNH